MLLRLAGCEGGVLARRRRGGQAGASPCGPIGATRGLVIWEALWVALER
jgi:hypothetical protein